ncbi:P-loop containing nucleoside triphosphate hydrolase protein [Punctularia strigosozonata HHB-11173 SS5]|uniref:P-loop containing nucleoside triphosphate hydrolase protein n=1 Tax=Punctularia strigosozonata (strain HHB-11173) TaxID=741275 RepID=UPI0004416354|nr:P-loop containing nucleoside triphosphate hydrolase protein [Punctularia strigosozonata HHB-11173 SS5]EIN05820.1 P-loop containing nucleoside triphosphate hydrolase protein [Punctularia strigosozonata HHB-11173 SS5]
MRTASEDPATQIRCGKPRTRESSQQTSTPTSTCFMTNDGAYAHQRRGPERHPAKRDRPTSFESWVIVVLGPAGVGKSTIVSNYVRDCFLGTHDPGAEDRGINWKKITVDRISCFVQVIDTAGQNMPETEKWIHLGQAFILVYDVTSRVSFDEPVCILVGNKCDRAYAREVSKAEGQQLAESCRCPFVEASAKTMYGVDEAFQGAVRILRSQPVLRSESKASFKSRWSLKSRRSDCILM